MKSPLTMFTVYLPAVMFKSNIKGNLFDLQKENEKLLFSMPTKFCFLQKQCNCTFCTQLR